MDTIKEWALSLTAACILTAVLSYVTPSGRFEKSVKVLISLFLLIAFFAPIMQVDTDSFVIKNNDGIEHWVSESALETKLRNQVIQILDKEIKSKISGFLHQQNIPFIDIVSDIDIDGDGNIYIRTIDVVLAEDVDKKMIEDFVLSSFGTAPKVVVKPGDNYG